MIWVKQYPREDLKGMNEEMGMTNKQFNGFIRLVIKAVKTALDSENPKTELENLLDILQSMLEDGN